jgi:phosphoserine aminotransferase
MVVIKKQWAEENARKEVPTMLYYKTHYDNESMFNTPPCLLSVCCSRTFKWIMAQGGLEAVQKNNEMKSKLLYDAIDAHSDFLQRCSNKSKRPFAYECYIQLR